MSNQQVRNKIINEKFNIMFTEQVLGPLYSRGENIRIIISLIALKALAVIVISIDSPAKVCAFYRGNTRQNGLW